MRLQGCAAGLQQLPEQVHRVQRGPHGVAPAALEPDLLQLRRHGRDRRLRARPATSAHGQRAAVPSRARTVFRACRCDKCMPCWARRRLLCASAGAQQTPDLADTEHGPMTSNLIITDRNLTPGAAAQLQALAHQYKGCLRRSPRPGRAGRDLSVGAPQQLLGSSQRLLHGLDVRQALADHERLAVVLQRAQEVVQRVEGRVRRVEQPRGQVPACGRAALAGAGAARAAARAPALGAGRSLGATLTSGLAGSARQHTACRPAPAVCAAAMPPVLQTVK